jgi:hypothetical protein
MAHEPNWESEILYPKKGDALIQGGGGKAAKALFADWMKGEWGFYADGYKRAADIIVDQVDGDAPDDILILPIIFLYRHYVEVKLKDVIIGLDRLSGTHMGKGFGTHNLISLWSYLKSHLDCIRTEPGNKEILPALDSLIAELATLDPDSFHFRYPYDKTLQQEMQLPHSLSMNHFKETMEKIEHGFAYIEAGIDLETEARGLDADLEAEMRLYSD